MKKQDQWYEKRTGFLAWLEVMVVLLLLRWISSFNGLYGQDSYEYVAYATELRDWIAGGPRPEPFYWPELYPLAGALLSFLVRDVAFGLQLMSMLSLATTAGLLTRLAPRTTDLPGGGFTTVTVIFVGLSPFMVRNGMMAMADSFATACITGAMLNWYVYQTRHTPRHLAGVLILSSMAVMARYPAAIIVVFFLAHSLWAGLKDRRFVALGIGAVFAIIPLWIHFRLQSNALPSHHFLEDWSMNNWFRRHFTMLDGSFRYTLPNIVFYLGAFYHPGFLGAAVLVLPRLIFRIRDLAPYHKLLLIPLLAYVLFLAGIPFQNQRFLLLVVPLVFFLYIHDLLFAFHLFHTKLGLYYAVLIGLVAINLALVYRTSHTFWEMSAREKEMAMEVRQGASPRVFTFGMEGALAYHSPDKEVISLYDSVVPPARSQDMVLFNYAGNARQWAGKSPMNNWEAIQEAHQLDTLRIFGQGWILYGIK